MSFRLASLKLLRSGLNKFLPVMLNNMVLKNLEVEKSQIYC